MPLSPTRLSSPAPGAQQGHLSVSSPVSCCGKRTGAAVLPSASALLITTSVIMSGGYNMPHSSALLMIILCCSPRCPSRRRWIAAKQHRRARLLLLMQPRGPKVQLTQRRRRPRGLRISKRMTLPVQVPVHSCPCIPFTIAMAAATTNSSTPLGLIFFLVQHCARRVRRSKLYMLHVQNQGW